MRSFRVLNRFEDDASLIDDLNSHSYLTLTSNSMERHSETFLASPRLADTVGAGRKRVHFNSGDQAQRSVLLPEGNRSQPFRSNDATSTGPDTGSNILEAQFSGKSAADQ